MPYVVFYRWINPSLHSIEVWLENLLIIARLVTRLIFRFVYILSKHHPCRWLLCSLQGGWSEPPVMMPHSNMFGDLVRISLMLATVIQARLVSHG